MTNLSNLQTSLSNLTAALATATASPKPSYSIDGQSVSHESYLAMLVTQIKALTELVVDAAGPYEEHTIGIT